MSHEPKTTKKKITDAIILVILLVILYYAYQFYQTNNFNEFVKSETTLYRSTFKRDKAEKYSKQSSYKIESPEYNDAMFFKTVKVEKNQPYKVTCMVKTKDVQSKDGNSGVGAQIVIEGTTERSIAIRGTTNGWQKIELIFNSKNREEVKIGFRLGGYLGKAKGEAWFSDFTLEEGISTGSNEWKFACFIFEQTDVNVNGKQVQLQMTPNDISDIKNTIGRFQETASELSQGKMRAQCDVYSVTNPLTSLSYDDQFAYYIAPEDIENHIKEIVNKNDYDHIFAIVRLGDEEHKNDIEINDWIGLGSMDYYGIGFSNIRLPNNSKNYIYKYNSRVNTFPEEVFLHEFLHSLERTAKEYGLSRPELHDYERFGYKNEALTGQKKWYADYMNKNINSTTGKIGLPESVYTLKPAKASDFEYSFKIEEFKQPENIIEEVREVFANIVRHWGQIFETVGTGQSVSQK